MTGVLAVIGMGGVSRSSHGQSALKQGLQSGQFPWRNHREMDASLQRGKGLLRGVRSFRENTAPPGSAAGEMTLYAYIPRVSAPEASPHTFHFNIKVLLHLDLNQDYSTVFLLLILPL